MSAVEGVWISNSVPVQVASYSPVGTGAAGIRCHVPEPSDALGVGAGGGAGEVDAVGASVGGAEIVRSGPAQADENRATAAATATAVV
jgi:hypothetical protein